MNNSQVAHKWANGQDASGSNFYSEDGTIYSYGRHFPIARICNDHILFTSGSYSISTSKHVSLTRRAIASSAIVIHVPDLRNAPSENEPIVASEIQELLRKHGKSRLYKEMIAGQIETAVANLSLYLKTYKAKPSKETKALLKLIASGEWAKVKELDATQEKAREKARALREAKANAALAEYQAKEKEKRNAWLEGEAVQFYGADENGNPFLRVKNRTVQTSHGAEIPLRPAMRLFELARNCQDSGLAFHEPLTFDCFTLTKITGEGNVTIGCHTLTFKEMARIAPTVQRQLA